MPLAWQIDIRGMSPVAVMKGMEAGIGIEPIFTDLQSAA
jgi:hypothetical protein